MSATSPKGSVPKSSSGPRGRDTPVGAQHALAPGTHPTPLSADSFPFNNSGVFSGELCLEKSTKLAAEGTARTAQ